MTDATTEPEARVLIGRISGLYGVQGWVKLYSYTQPRDNLLGYREVELGLAGSGAQRRWTTAQLLDGRRQGKTLVARIAGVDDRDAAAPWVGAAIAIRRAALPPTSRDEFYWVDLIGLAVENTDGVALGKVASLIETGAHDVLVVEGERQRLIPFVVGPIVLEVDLAGGRIRVDWDADY